MATPNPDTGGGRLHNELAEEVRMTREYVFTCERCGKREEAIGSACPSGWEYISSKDLCLECYKGLRSLRHRQDVERAEYLGNAQKGGG